MSPYQRPSLSPSPAILIALGLIVLVEIGLRAGIPSGGVHYDYSRQEYISAVREIDDSGTRNVAIVGSSRSREGVLANELGRHLGLGKSTVGKVGNYGLAGAHAAEVDVLVQHMLRSSAQPKLVLYGVGPRQLLKRSGSPYQKLNLLWDLPLLFRQLQLEGFDAWSSLGNATRNSLASVSWLFRYRFPIRKALTAAPHPKIWKELQQETTPAHGQAYNPARGERTRWNQKRPKQSRKISKQRIATYLVRVTGEGNPYVMDSAQIERLARTVRALRTEGIDVVLFSVPINGALLKQLPPDVYSDFEKEMEELAKQTGAYFLSKNELALKLRRKDFREQSHLNLAGAKKLTKRLAGRIQELNAVSVP